MADRYVKAHRLTRKYMENLPTDPDERQKELSRRRAEIGKIMAGGPTAAPTAGGPTILINGQPAQPAGATGASATADALTRLADLRDRGRPQRGRVRGTEETPARGVSRAELCSLLDVITAWRLQE